MTEEIKHKVVARLEGKHIRKIIKKKYDVGINCNSCNWETSILYSFDSNNIDEEGLCGECFCGMLADDGSEVIR